MRTGNSRQVLEILIMFFFYIFTTNYKSEDDMNKCDDFFSKLNLPKLTEDQQSYLDSPIKLKRLRRQYH